MRRYDHLQDDPRDFLAATGLTLAEFVLLLPALEAASDDYTIEYAKWQHSVNHVIARCVREGKVLYERV